ncbi:hypothetical protein ACLB2K_045053 [Fragaria x ananassa]
MSNCTKEEFVQILRRQSTGFARGSSKYRGVTLHKCGRWEARMATRGFHSTRVKRMGGHGHDEPFYMHSKHMYNLDLMKHQALKMSLGVFTAFSIGVGVPVFAVIFQQKKTASG